MIEKDTAIAKARSFIAGLAVDGGNDLVLLEDKLIERSFGWVFFYQSQRFLDTANPLHAILGNAPLIVDRRDGSLHLTGTAQPIEYYIERYEAEHR